MKNDYDSFSARITEIYENLGTLVREERLDVLTLKETLLAFRIDIEDADSDLIAWRIEDIETKVVLAETNNYRNIVNDDDDSADISGWLFTYE